MTHIKRFYRIITGILAGSLSGFNKKYNRITSFSMSSSSSLAGFTYKLIVPRLSLKSHNSPFQWKWSFNLKNFIRYIFHAKLTFYWKLTLLNCKCLLVCDEYTLKRGVSNDITTKSIRDFLTLICPRALFRRASQFSLSCYCDKYREVQTKYVT